ncbi:MAG: MutS-related protein, partial [Planctomycetota bacterium]
IARLLNDLAILIQRRHDEIVPALRTLAQIDLICAKAQYAYQFDFVRPEMTERGGLRLSQARHPLLLEQAYQQEREGVPPDQRHPVVPIDVRLGVDFDVLIITGSNTGGKTVALKTVALLSVMAQSGMHIPAGPGSTLPLFRDILLDVGDEQSLQQSLSTFGAHIRRVRHILRKADRYSLVLMDELGSGTDPEEGGSIGQAVLDELRRIGCLAMISTHLGVLKAYAFNHDRVDNASVEFDTRTLRPTFHLRIGEPGESHAITVAAAMGMPRHVIAAARKHFGRRGSDFRRAIRATRDSRRKSEEALSDARTAQLAAEDAQEQYAQKMDQLHRLQGHFESWLASLAEFKPGDEVPLPKRNKTGRLVRLQLNKQIAVVDVDNVQVEVPLAELMPDLGQGAVRREIASLREQILAQARESEAIRAEAERLHAEYQRSLTQQRSRRLQFEAWLSDLARARVGQVVPITKAPGRGKLLELNLPLGKATLDTSRGKVELPVQDLFPQSGPFARRKKPARGPAEPQARRKAKAPEKTQRPVIRRSPDSARAKANRQAVLATSPGQELYVVPFRKRARLIRFNPGRDEAVVQTGPFEMEIPIADLEPAR